MSTHKLRSADPGTEPEPTRTGRLFLPGATVGHWVVTGILREEPDHVLYEATAGPGGAPATLKVLDVTGLHDGRYYRCLRRAARRWKRVDHPHLARLLDAGKSTDGPFLATQPVEGPSLALELESGALGHSRAAGVVLELAGALDAALDAGMVPAALTPRNAVMAAGGVVVTDPGIGRARHTESLIEADDALDYLSPEEAVGAPPDAQSSVYSLACIAFHCLTGQPPYPHELPQAVLYAHIAEPPAPPHSRDRSLPKALDAVFEQAMAADPDERHPTPGVFARELAATLGYAEESVAKAAEPERPALAVLPGGLERTTKPEGATKPQPATKPAAAPAERRHRRLAGRSRSLLRPVVAVIAIAACTTAGFAIGSAGDPDTSPPVVPRAEPGPPAGALAAQTVAERLDASRSRLRARLAKARRRAGQAEIAARLANAYSSTARRAPASTPPDLRAALRGSARAYAGLAVAARGGGASGWAAARARAQSADRALADALRRSATSR